MTEFLAGVGLVSLWLLLGLFGVRVARVVDKAQGNTAHLPFAALMLGPATLLIAVAAAIIIGDNW